jgi:hypothetical protein
MWNTGVIDENGNAIFIKLIEAPSYLTEEFYQALHVFYTTENLGVLPFSGGWAEQPEWIVNVLNTLKIEQALWEQSEAEERRKSSK